MDEAGELPKRIDHSDTRQYRNSRKSHEIKQTGNLKTETIESNNC